jgi:hypothetical protein
MPLSTHASALQKREEEAIGYSESPRQGRAAAASMGKNGNLSYSLSGSSPQGEEDTLRACQILVTKLNEAGGDWDQPSLVCDGPVDCAAIDREDASCRLYIQVVRANVDSRSWATLNQTGKIEETGVAKQTLVEQIKAAIEAKANDRKLPMATRRGLVLALDATRLPASGFDSVVREFRSKWGDWANKLGFDGIWLVGPLDSLTWRLDE